MKRFFPLLFLFAGCQAPKPYVPDVPPPHFYPLDNNTPYVVEVPRPVAPAPKPEYPVAIPVPGKPGFVYSPYDKLAGFVDVREIASGKKAMCPFTHKIFIVP